MKLREKYISRFEPWQLCVGLTILISIVWCALMSYFSLYQYDDLYYIDIFRTNIDNGDDSTTANYFSFFANHYATWNGRFGDKLCPLLLGLLPRWLFSAITGMALGVLLCSAIHIIFPPYRKSFRGRLMTIAAFIIIMPWLGFIFFGAHSINYIWGSAIGFAVIALFVSNIKCNFIGGVLLLLLAILAGSWHEEFTFICAPSLLVWLAVYRGKLPTSRILILVGGIIGALFIINSGGFWSRINREHHVLLYMNEDMVWRIVRYANFSLLVPIFALLALAVPALRHRYPRAQLAVIAMCGTAVVLNMYLSSTLYVEPRYWWFADVFGIIGLGVALLPLRFHHIPAIIKTLACSVLMIFMLAHMIISVIWVHRLCDQREEIERLYSESPDGVVYVDRLSAHDAPPLALGRGYDMQLRYLMRSHRLENLCRDDSLLLNVLPAAMVNFSPEEIVPVPKCNHLSLYKWHGILVSTDTSYFHDRDHYETCVHSNGDTLRYKLEFNRFYDRNGQLWVQIEPHPLEKPYGTEVIQLFKIIRK